MDYKIKFFSVKEISHWVIVVFGIIVGAFIGWIISNTLNPIYEAKSVVTTNMELREDGMVSEIMLDEQIGHIGSLVFNPDVTSELIELEESQGNTLTLEDLHNESSIERQMMNTVIKVKDIDPNNAARIASEWAEIFFNRLNVAYIHAVKLSAAKLQFDALQKCNLNSADALDTLCNSLTNDQLTSEIDKLSNIILEESPQTLGLTVALNVSQYQPAEIPSKPLQYQTSGMILAGAITGLIVSIFIAEYYLKLKGY